MLIKHNCNEIYDFLELSVKVLETYFKMMNKLGGARGEI